MKGVIVVLIFMVLSQMLLAKVREIWLKEGDLIDGIFGGITEEDGFVTAQFAFHEEVKIEYPKDSVEAEILEKELSGMERNRVLVYRQDNENEPLRIAKKRER